MEKKEIRKNTMKGTYFAFLRYEIVKKPNNV